MQQNLDATPTIDMGHDKCVQASAVQSVGRCPPKDIAKNHDVRGRRNGGIAAFCHRHPYCRTRLQTIRVPDSQAGVMLRDPGPQGQHNTRKKALTLIKDRNKGGWASKFGKLAIARTFIM